MFNFEGHQKLTKDLILQNIGEERIFERYLGIIPNYSKQYRNPFRIDNNPGCNFYIDKQNRIKFIDSAYGFNWDCFNVVEYLNSCSFKEAIKIVARDFGLFNDGLAKSNPAAIREEKQKEKKQIRVEFRRDNHGHILWLQEDKEFWYDKYYLTRQDLYDTFPVSRAWYLRGTGELELFYYYKAGDPCYAYCLGGYEYKLYFPKREKGKKFRHTSSHLIQGINLLPEKGHILIITKSYKDALCIIKMGKDIGLYAIAPMSETMLIEKSIIDNLKERFDYIFTLFDFDRAGIRLMRKYYNAYQLEYLMFGKSFRHQSIKDFADHVDVKGWEDTNTLIKEVYNERIG